MTCHFSSKPLKYVTLFKHNVALINPPNPPLQKGGKGRISPGNKQAYRGFRDDFGSIEALGQRVADLPVTDHLNAHLVHLFNGLSRPPTIKGVVQ